MKNFHQATTAALQQFLPGSAMTTIAYGNNSAATSISTKNREDERQSHVAQVSSAASQKQVSSTYLGSPAVAHSQSQPQVFDHNNHRSHHHHHQQHQQQTQVQQVHQQQHIAAAYQHKFTEAANMQPQQQTEKKSSKSSKTSKSKRNTTSSAIPPDAHTSQQYPNVAQQYYPKSSTAPDPIKSGVPPPGVPGSAFNFGPTPTGLSLYGDATANYLDDFRGAANPYSAYLGHRPPPQTTAEMTAAAAAAAAAVAVDKAANPSTVSSAYHQFLPHPGARAGYPFPAAFDPIQQQWNIQRQEELRAQMMLTSPYSQSGPYPRHLWG